MALTIDLRPEQEEQLVEAARRVGIGPNELASRLVQSHLRNLIESEIARPGEEPESCSAEGNEIERRREQIEFLAMSRPPQKPGPNDWLKTVGKYPEGHPVNVALDKGYAMRVADRNNQCEQD